MPFDKLLVENGETPRAVLSNRFHQRHMCPAPPTPAAETQTLTVLLPGRQIRYQIDAKRAAASQDTMNGVKRCDEIAFSQERLQHTVRRQHGPKCRDGKRKVADIPPNEAYSPTETGTDETLPSASEHRSGPVDADDANAGATERKRDASRPGTEFERMTRSTERKLAPE
jgi:hypothetical protein